MSYAQPYRIKTITEYHRLTHLPKPEHPLVSVIDLALLNPDKPDGPVSLVFEFYTISFKKQFIQSLKYGQQTCDFDEGVLFCTAPGQVLGFEIEADPARKPAGWMMLIHPDFLWGSSLAKSIQRYPYFSYSVYEGLYLSEKEEAMISGIVRYINQECRDRIDKFSQDVIIAQLEVILTYTERFYERQFVTRKIASHQLVSRVEEILNEYFIGASLAESGLPTVSHIAGLVNVSPGYLSELLKVVTGLNTQQHIHNKLIEKAKEKLSTTDLSVSEIAYELGFEHLQSFSKLFKTKTNLSPLQFRRSFN